MPSPWITVATGGECTADRAEIRRALGILFAPGEHRELRAVPSGRKEFVSGDDLDAATEAAFRMSDEKVCFILNPIRADARTSKKETVTCRRWMLVDVDPVRPDGVSSTDDEKTAAAALAGAVIDHLAGLGWPFPVMTDSGNGWHLLYRIDLPNDALSQQIVKGVLHYLGDQFDTAGAIVDRKCHDAPRPCKLPGTWSRKGPDLPDRPHRMARIAFEPDPIEVVPVETLQALGRPTPPPVPPTTNGHAPASPFTTKASDGPGKTSYVRRAIESECYRVALAPSGTRNDQLNRSAFALGQFDHPNWPEFDAAAARDQLGRAAERAGLAAHEFPKTIASGWEAGRKDPRPRPVEAQVQTNGKAQTVPSGKRIIWARDVKTRKVEWLDPGRIPIGKMTTFAGQTGLGKTFTVCDLAARVSRGMEIPFANGLCYQQGKVLIISAEDDADDTIVPRFLELGGDPDRMAMLSPESEENFSLSALELLNGCIDDMGSDVRMVAIDPPTSYLGRVDDHKNAELRGLLRPLRNWCRDRRVALIFVTHVNKGGGAQKIEALARVMGGVGWVTAVRSAHMFCPDPGNQDRKLYLPLKANNTGNRKGLAYRIVATPGDLAILEWLEEVDMTADDAMNQVMPRKSAGMTAVEWLTDRFREHLEWPSEELKRLARDFGLSFNQVFKSPEVNALPIDKKRRTDAEGNVYFVWRARKGWPLSKSPESSESCSVSPSDETPF